MTFLPIEVLIAETTLMDALPTSEWNFSTVAPTELATCIRYELAREIKDWASYFDQEVDYSDVHSMSDLDIVYNNTSFLFPEIEFPSGECIFNAIWPGYYPEVPWLDIPQGERAETARRYEGNKRAIASYSDGTTIRTRTVDKYGFEVRPFSIDWKQSDGSIIDDFREWLTEHRPAHIPVEIERGRQSLRDQLNAISAMRLRHRHLAAQAADLTATVLGKPLYSGSFAWDRAAKRGLDLFQATFPKAGEPRSAEQKTRPRGRPPK